MINWPKGYKENLEDILGVPFSGNSINFSFGNYENVGQAKMVLKKMVLIKRELSAVKKSANEEMKQIRLSFQIEKERVSQSGGAITQIFFGKKAAGHERQSQRTTISSKQKETLLPYENVKSTIDTILLEIDKVKFEVEKKIATNSF